MALPLDIKEPLRPVTDPKEVETFARVIASAFIGDALNRYFFLGQECYPDNPKLQQFESRIEYWEKVIQPRFENKGLLVQSHDWAAVALWLPPGVEKPPPANSSMLSEGVQQYRNFFEALRKEKLGNRHHWHLNLIGRDPARNDRGAVTAIFEPVLQDAKAKNLPIWLESTNKHAKEVYERFGFKVVGEVRIGNGVVGSDGWLKDNGEGVLMWGMIAGLDGW